MEECLWSRDCAAAELHFGEKSSTEVSQEGLGRSLVSLPGQVIFLPNFGFYHQYLRLNAQVGVPLESLANPTEFGARTMLTGALGFGETLQTWLGADKTSPSTEPNSHFVSFGRICLQQWKSRCDNPVPGSAAGNRTGMCSTTGVKRMFSRRGLSSCSVL